MNEGVIRVPKYLKLFFALPVVRLTLAVRPGRSPGKKLRCAPFLRFRLNGLANRVSDV